MFNIDETTYSYDEVEKILRLLSLVRVVEEQIVANYGKPGEVQNMRCPVHLSIGQEAAAVGVCANLSNNDKVFSTHRCHAHYLAKGGSLRKMILELHGKVGGCLDGRGGSMHLMDPEAGVVSSVPIVSSSIPLAVGSALADQIDNKNSITVAFFGDASMEEGVYHESANFAALKKLPVIFVCENNLFSVYSHLNERQPNRDLEMLGAAHGLPVIRADGNDVFDVYKNFKQLLGAVRDGDGPALFIMDTYRYREHCGVNFDDHLNYRDPEEVKKWEARDPINIAHAKVKSSGCVDQEFLNRQLSEINKIVQGEFSHALQAPLPKPKAASHYVYSK